MVLAITPHATAAHAQGNGQGRSKLDIADARMKSFPNYRVDMTIHCACSAMLGVSDRNSDEKPSVCYAFGDVRLLLWQTTTVRFCCSVTIEEVA